MERTRGMRVLIQANEGRDIEQEDEVGCLGRWFQSQCRELHLATFKCHSYVIQVVTDLLEISSPGDSCLHCR